MGARPPMGPPPTGTGPAAATGGMMGNQMAGMEKVKIGVKALIDSLPMLPLGSEMQQAVMKAVQDIGKHVPEAGGGGDPQALVQMLAMMGREAKAQPGQAGALQQMMGGGGAPPPGAGAPPPGGM
jgi:hypothetical protein